MQNYVKTFELNLTKKRWTHYTLYSVTFALYFSTLHLHDFSSATNSPYVSWCFSGINLNILLKLMLKKTPNIKNWYIPYILSVLGIVASVIIEGININSIIQGLIAAGIAVYSHQLGKQCINCISKSSDKSTE